MLLTNIPWPRRAGQPATLTWSPISTKGSATSIRFMMLSECVSRFHSASAPLASVVLRVKATCGLRHKISVISPSSSVVTFLSKFEAILWCADPAMGSVHSVSTPSIL